MTTLDNIKSSYSEQAYEIAKEGVSAIGIEANWRVQDDAVRQMVEILENDEGLCPEWNQIAKEHPSWAMELAGAMAYKVVEDRNWTDAETLAYQMWTAIAENHTIQEAIEFHYVTIPDEDLADLDVNDPATIIQYEADWVNWDEMSDLAMRDVNRDGYLEVTENYYEVGKTNLSEALPVLMAAVDHGLHECYTNNNSHSVEGSPTEVFQSIKDGYAETFNLAEPELHTNPAYVLDALHANADTWNCALHFQYQNPDLVALYKEQGIDAVKDELQERLCASREEAFESTKTYGRQAPLFPCCTLPRESTTTRG